MMGVWVALGVGLGACYAPSPPTGAPCGEPAVCPIRQTCQRGVCVAQPGTDGSGADAAGQDSDATGDSSPPDAGPPPPITLVDPSKGVSGFGFTASEVAYADNASNLVVMTVANGTTNSFAIGTQSPNELVLDASSVFWGDYSGNKVFRLDRTTSAIATLDSNVSAPGPIAIDANSVYYSTDGAAEQIFKHGKAIGSTRGSLISTGGPDAITVAAGALFWVSGGSAGTKTINRIDLSTGVNTVLATPADVNFGFIAIASDGTRVWATDYGAHLYAVDVGTTTTTEVVSGGTNRVFGALAVGASYIYWIDRPTSGDGAIRRMLKTGGGAIETVAEGQPSLGHLGVVGTFVVWTAGGGLYGLVESEP